MKITINLHRELIQRATKASLDSGKTLSEFIEDALRDALAGRRNRKPGREFKVITSGRGGLLPGVNLDDSSALQDIMEPPDEIRMKLTN